MRAVLYKAVPWRKEEVTLALESGVDGLIVPDEQAEATRALARCSVIPARQTVFVRLDKKADEERAAALARESGAASGAPLVVLERGWEIIPLENLLAATPRIAVEAAGREEALLAAGVLERGVDTVVVPPEGLSALKDIVAALKYSPPDQPLAAAVITRIAPAGMGHRVCVDTTSLLRSGQGMLVGNSAAFTFLVNAETERNEYVAARPFRVNAGGVHAYARMPEDRTAYLEELRAGSEVLIVDHTGACGIATVGRVKVERRPMLLLEAEIRAPETKGRSAQNAGQAPDRTAGQGAGQPAGNAVRGTVFLQNAETIRLVTPGGVPVSVVNLREGDTVLCRADAAGRHFGMRITEDIQEI